MTHLFAVFLLLLLGWFWLDSLRAREFAIEICKAACAQHDIQLLDQTVALQHLRLAWPPDGVRVRRTYRFEFSTEGLARHRGHLTLLGLTLEELHFDLPGTSVEA